MRSMPQALIWETFAHGKWTLLSIFSMANLLPLLVYGALSRFAFDPQMKEFIVLQMGFVQIVLFQLAAGVAFAQGPLSRLYALPISTHSIVAWHMLSGAVILAVEMVASSYLFNLLFHVNWPIIGPAIFAIAAWSAVQVLMSVSSQQSVPAFLVAGSPAILLCLWLNGRYGSWLSPAKHYWSEVTAVEVVTLFVAFVVCYVMTNYSVGYSRCGERMPTLGIVAWIERQWEAFTAARRSPRPFRSAADAQFWYEWHVKGVALPLITVIMLLCVITWNVVAWIFQATNLISLYDATLFVGGFITLLACAAGLFLGLEVDSKAAGQRDTQLGDSVSELQLVSGMGSYLGSRPFSNKQFAAALLRTSAQGTILSWLAWATVLLTCLLTMWLLQIRPNSYLPDKIGLLFVPLTILGPWIAMSNLATIGLSGRGTTMLTIGVTASVAYCVLLGALNSVISTQVVQQIHTTFTLILAILSVPFSIWLYIRAMKQEQVSMKTLLLAAFAFVVILVAAVLLRPENTQLLYYPSAVLFAVLVVIPFASTPLAIAWNRHR